MPRFNTFSLCGGFAAEAVALHELVWDKQTTVFITHKELFAASRERSV